MARRLARESVAARRQFALAGALGLLAAAVVLAQATLLAQVISRAATAHAPLAALRAPLIALAGVLLARALVAGGFELSGRLAARRVMSDLRVRVARALFERRPGRRPHERTGELVATAVQGIDSLEAYFAGYLPSLVLAVAVPVAVLARVAPLDLPAAVALAVTVPILILFMILIGKGAQARTRSRWRALSLLSSHFLDVVRGLGTLRAHRREHAQAQILERVGQRYRRETMGTLRLAFLSALVLELCAMVGTALVAGTIGVQLVTGSLSLQAGLTVLLLAPELYGPLRSVGQSFHAAADGLAAAERLLGVLHEPADIAPPPGDRHRRPAPDPARVPLRFEAVCVHYSGRSRQALDRVTLQLAPGELVALLGESGAGKSTLAALALRLIDPTEGQVCCGGVDLRELDPGAWRSRVAWVPQRPRLFAGTLHENISLADPSAPRQLVVAAACTAGLWPLLETMPDGLNTTVGDGGRRLSAGQAQRVAFARALVRDASLVVLDEPTANLDCASAREFADVIAQLARGRTTLLITHDRQLAQLADRTVQLRAGRLLGEPGEESAGEWRRSARGPLTAPGLAR